MSSEANSRIGVEDLTFSKVLTDVDGGSTTYDTPWALGKKSVKLSVKNSSSMEKQYADDQAVAVYTEDGDIDFGIDVTDLTEDEKAVLLGQTMSNGIRSPSPDDVRPYWAVSFKAKKRSGAYKYYKLLKVIFNEPDEDFETKKEKVTPQEEQISGVGIQRISDGRRKRIADSESSTYVSTVGSTWFDSGDISPDTTAPTISSVDPADEETGVVVTDNIVVTFDEEIQEATVTTANFLLSKDEGTAVAGSVSLDSTKKIVTFNPTSSLDASSTYIFTVTTNVKDLSGNALAANSVTNFTTAA